MFFLCFWHTASETLARVSWPPNSTNEIVSTNEKFPFPPSSSHLSDYPDLGMKFVWPNTHVYCLSACLEDLTDSEFSFGQCVLWQEQRVSTRMGNPDIQGVTFWLSQASMSDILISSARSASALSFCPKPLIKCLSS